MLNPALNSRRERKLPGGVTDFAQHGNVLRAQSGNLLPIRIILVPQSGRSRLTQPAEDQRSQLGCVVDALDHPDVRGQRRLAFTVASTSSARRFDNEVRTNTVVICEKWASIEALQAHTRSSPALNNFRAKVKDIKLESSYLLLTPATGSRDQAT